MTDKTRANGKAEKNGERASGPADLSHLVDKTSFSGVDFEAIERAEKALKKLSNKFDSWMGEEIGTLAAARDKAHAENLSAEALDAVFRAAHDIKGEADTLGYPLAAKAAASLCRLLDGVAGPDRVPTILLDQHVDAIRAIVREHDMTRSGDIAERLVGQLSFVTDDYLEQEEARVAALIEADEAEEAQPEPEARPA